MNVSKKVYLVYKNHKNEVEVRHICPFRIWFGCTAYHRDPQWLMDCFDIDKCDERTYAMSGIMSPFFSIKQPAQDMLELMKLTEDYLRQQGLVE